VRLTPEAVRPDITMHFPVEAWVDHVVSYGIDMPPYYMAIAPNVSKPRSRTRGRPDPPGSTRGAPG
jgi:hypothetical protein